MAGAFTKIGAKRILEDAPAAAQRLQKGTPALQSIGIMALDGAARMLRSAGIWTDAQLAAYLSQPNATRIAAWASYKIPNEVRAQVEASIRPKTKHFDPQTGELIDTPEGEAPPDPTAAPSLWHLWLGPLFGGAAVPIVEAGKDAADAGAGVLRFFGYIMLALVLLVLGIGIAIAVSGRGSRAR